MSKSNEVQRVAFSPGEFASLFGKSQTWGYRQIYAGKVTAITEHGRILIPAKEVERVLRSAGIYNGREKPKEQRARISKLPEKERSVWQRFIAARKGTNVPGNGTGSPPAEGVPKGWKSSSRRSETERIARSWSKPARSARDRSK